MMNDLLRHGRLLLAGLLVSCAGASDYETPQVPPPPPPAPAEAPPQAPEPYPEASPSMPPPSDSEQPQAAPPTSPAPPPTEAAPPAAQSVPAPPVYSYPTGQWVYLSGRGWVWVPAGATTQDVEGAPYVYLYTPSYGWTWYLSPWGWGPYRYGAWARHPWHPGGWHGYWAAHPRVVVRLGHGHFHH